MPIHYIGRHVNWKGKKLFDILCNLNKFGVGRIVIRYSRQHYPEPCFYKVVKAEPNMDAEGTGTVWLETIFRGVNCGVQSDLPITNQDWQLIPKDEEEKFLKHEIKSLPDYKIFPATKEFPPLFRELILRERKAQGLSINEEPQLPVQIVSKQFNRYRLANKGEKPTEKFTTHARPELYEETNSSK